MFLFNLVLFDFSSVFKIFEKKKKKYIYLFISVFCFSVCGNLVSAQANDRRPSAIERLAIERTFSSDRAQF
jgi:hypothetical protein